jgi:hypothetical protein
MITVKNNLRSLCFFATLAIIAAIIFAFYPSKVSEASSTAGNGLFTRAVPNIDTNLTAAVTRVASAAQQQAINNFQSTYGSQATVRWDNFAGSPDVIMNFHTAPSTETPENAARAFIDANSGLLAVDSASLVLDYQKEGMGGYMLRFQQRVGGIDVAGGGIGVLMNADKQIRMVMGSPFRDVSVPTTPSLTGAVAAARAEADIARYSNTPYNAAATAGLDVLAAELAPALRAPRLNIFPTADGYKLAWDVITLSRNPFGLYLTQVDASNGEILRRDDVQRTQESPLPYTADIYPSTPGIANYDTGALKLVNGEPEGLTRVFLRGYNPGMNATAIEGTLSGPHAFVRNALATKQPFVQPAAGTFHFRQNNAPVESHPNEADDLAEPAEHFDGVNMFFFINYLLEYVDDIHRRDDNTGFGGQGAFPDSYPSSDRPLVGIVHVPNIGANSATYAPYRTNDPVGVALGYDNAGSFPLTQTVDTPAGRQQIVINPTIYGHGYLLNDLAKDGPVAYHEGMHSITTPIAGWEGTEGAAMNEGQADMWAYTITNGDTIGDHSVKGARYRQRFRDRGTDPETISYIRSGNSTLKYSTIGTYKATATAPPAFEEHRDGEVFAATMLELRRLMIAAEPQATQFKRPSFGNGQPTTPISRGQESFERLLLGQAYLLGLSNPDTMINARDAILQADRILYSTDPSDIDAPGQHEALIWQVFAAREMGMHASGLQGGVVTISTAVPQSVTDVPHLGAPQGVTVAPGSTSSVRVSWQPVSGGYAYQVFKRKRGTAGQRQYRGIPGRPFFDGDQAITGWSHVAYVTGGSSNSFEDKGVIEEIWAARGIKSVDNADGFNEMFDTEYAVRAISYNSNRSSGFSDLSGTAGFTSSNQDITTAIQTAVSNISFNNGIFEFDQTLKNKGVSGVDSTVYGPINFKIIGTSNPTVTVANADNGGDGRSVPAVFNYNQTLPINATSSAKRLKFNDPGAQLFTFDALVTGRIRGSGTIGTGSQSYDGDGGGQQEHVITSQTDTYTGTVLIGSVEVRGAVSGVDYVDVPFVAKPGAFGVTGVMTTGVPADLDFELRDSNGNVLDSSGNFITDESCSGVIVPGNTYVYRVIGYVGAATPFTITSTQFFSESITSGGSSFTGTQTQGITNVRLVRVTVNPLTRAVSVRLL